MVLPAPDPHHPLPGPSRRGSNVSLTLDMCTPGCNEEGFGYLMSPREESAREYLLSASRVLQAEELHEKALDPFLLQAEFFVSPPEPAPLQGPALYAHVGPLSKALEQGTPNSASDEHRFMLTSPTVLDKLLPLWASVPHPENGDKDNRGVARIQKMQNVCKVPIR